MANIGYIRVSIHRKNVAEQLQDLTLDKTFIEENIASSFERPQLEACLKYLKYGDTLHVQSIDRLAKNTGMLEKVLKDLIYRGITVRFHTENLTFLNDDSSVQMLLFNMVHAFVQFDKNLLRERQLEGIERARKDGRHIGRPRKISLDDRKDIFNKLQEGKSPIALAEEYGVSVSSIYKIQKQRTGVSVLD